jgi:hypothetical protein
MQIVNEILMELSMAGVVVFGIACLVTGLWCEQEGGE